MKKDLVLTGEKFILIGIDGLNAKSVTDEVFDSHSDALSTVKEPGLYVVMPVYVIESKNKKVTNAKSTPKNNGKGETDKKDKAQHEMDVSNQTGQQGTEEEETNKGGEEENPNP